MGHEKKPLLLSLAVLLLLISQYLHLLNSENTPMNF